MGLHVLSLAAARPLTPPFTAVTSIANGVAALVTVPVSSTTVPKFTNGDVVAFTGGTIGTGLVLAYGYFVVSASAVVAGVQTFKLALTPGGTPIDTTGATTVSGMKAFNYSIQAAPAGGVVSGITQAVPGVATVGITAGFPGVVNGDQVVLAGSGSVGAGLLLNKIYYVVAAGSITSTQTFELSLTRGGAAITTTGATSTPITVYNLTTGSNVVYGPYDLQNVPAQTGAPQIPGSSSGQGTPVGAGETPFLPNYSVALWYTLASPVGIGSLDIQGSDDGVTWVSYLPAALTATGTALVFIKSLYRYIRVLVTTTDDAATGTITASLLGDG